MDTIILDKVVATLDSIYTSEFEKFMNRMLASEICSLLDTNIGHDVAFDAVKDLIYGYYKSSSVDHAAHAVFYRIGLGFIVS